MSEWRERAGPWARMVTPDGQALDVIVTGRERTRDGQWWYACEVLLPDRHQGPDGSMRPTAAPVAITVHADHITPIPGERYDTVPTSGAVAGRQWVLTRVRMPVMDGAGWWLHRRNCWQITGEHQQITMAEAAEEYAAGRARACDVCRPETAVTRWERGRPPPPRGP